MGVIFTILGLLAVGGLCIVEGYGVLKYIPWLCGLLLLTSCLSFTTTERPATASTVTRTETVYLNENGTRVRRIVTVDASGRRYYVEGGRTIYVDDYEY
jgi:hypothetical protein